MYLDLLLRGGVCISGQHDAGRVCFHVCVHACLCACVSACACVHAFMHVHMHVCEYVGVCVLAACECMPHACTCVCM